MKKNTFLSFLLCLFFATGFYAQTTYYVKSGGNNAGGLDEANAFSTVNNARAAASDNDIIIIVGAITQTGQVVLDKSLNFQGQDTAIINGVDNDVDTPSDRLYLVNAAGLTITFNGITFQGSKNKGFNGAVVSLEAASTLTFTDCIFDNNSTKGAFQGGVMYASNGTMNFTTSVFKNNTSGRSGGALYANSTENATTFNITGCTFYNNLAQGIGGSDGGAVLLIEGVSGTLLGQVTITNSTFFENDTTRGSIDYGAIRSTNANVSVTNSLFYNNKINGGAGASSDFGSAPGGTQSFTNSVGEWISNNVDTRTNFIAEVKTPVGGTAANLTNSNLAFNNNRVIFTAPSLLTDHTPIDFGSDNSDVGAWDSKINLFKGTTDSDWATGTNWSSTVAPTATENVTLLSDSPALVIGGSTNATINNLSVNGSSSLTINSGGTLIVNGTSSGNVTYNRALAFASGDAVGWHLVGSPVAGQAYNNAFATTNVLATSTTNTTYRGIATYNDANASGSKWTYLVNNDSNVAAFSSISSGLGLSVKRASAGDITFTGTINTTDVTPDISGTGGTIKLLANPYSSFVNSGTFLTDNANLDLNIWTWNDTGVYTSRASGEGFVLAPGQGFFVKANSGTTVTFAESNQASTGGAFQKSSRTEIKLLMNDGTNNRFARLFYLDNATTGYDAGWEGETFPGIKISVDLFTQLVSNNEGKNYQLQSLPLAELESLVVPVGVRAAAGKEITFSVEHTNVPTGVKTLLEDRELNTFTELTATETLKVTLNNALDGIGRFYIHTSSNALSVDDNNVENVSIYKTNNTTLRFVGLSQGKASVKLFNILGKQVLHNTFVSNGVQDLQLPKLATGVYIVQLETAKGKLNKKIILE